jgi:hypothetical protein
LLLRLFEYLSDLVYALAVAWWHLVAELGEHDPHDFDPLCEHLCAYALCEMLLKDLLVTPESSSGNQKIELPISEILGESQIVHIGCQGFPMFLSFYKRGYHFSTEDLACPIFNFY